MVEKNKGEQEWIKTPGPSPMKCEEKIQRTAKRNQVPQFVHESILVQLTSADQD
jgi:hypothetical protein